MSSPEPEPIMDFSVHPLNHLGGLVTPEPPTDDPVFCGPWMFWSVVHVEDDTQTMLWYLYLWSRHEVSVNVYRRGCVTLCENGILTTEGIAGPVLARGMRNGSVRLRASSEVETHFLTFPDAESDSQLHIPLEKSFYALNSTAMFDMSLQIVLGGMPEVARQELQLNLTGQFVDSTPVTAPAELQSAPNARLSRVSPLPPSRPRDLASEVASSTLAPATIPGQTYAPEYHRPQMSKARAAFILARRGAWRQIARLRHRD